MKLFFSDSLGYFYSKDGQVKASLLEGKIFNKIEGKWFLQKLDNEKLFAKYVKINGAKIPVYKINSGTYLYDGVEPESWLEKELSNIDPSYLIAVEDDFILLYNQDESHGGIVSNCKEGPYKFTEKTKGVRFKGGFIYIQGERKKSNFQKRDKKFDLVWDYKLPRHEPWALPPLLFDDSVLFISPSDEKEEKKTKIRVLMQVDGAEKWTKEYGFKAKECFIYNEALVVSSLDGVYFLSPINGDVLDVVDVSNYKQRERGLSLENASTHIDGDSLFYSNYLIGSLFVYNLSDLTLKKEISLPQGIHIKRFMGKDEASGLYYFYASQPRKEVGNTFLLELDPNNLDAPIEFEPTPDISSRFVAAEDTPEQCELHIDITTESLDDAIRFGEITVRKLAMQHSLSLLRSGPCLAEQGLKPDERFNGTIRLILHDVQGDTAQIDEYLATLKQRVDEWAAGFDTLVGWFKNPATGGYIRTQVFPRRAGQPEQVRILPNGNTFAEYELDDFVSDLESDTLKLDNKHYVARLTELTETITSEQSSPQDMATATYFRGALAYMNNDEQAALEHYFTAAQQGCFTGVLSYMDSGAG
ncbi:hypothetical protein MHM93_16010 [Pseudoalteromonas sp. MM17-2]|uniref:hypothetical protein n=1 Tax=Pseudoalteromonas sp. MM17-2 TaxID=2917753 RepID=UPI001EF7300A|nr:hypothetical protein [Pseudoalteromonas sp. MM17-2]MCG7545687.1 hypothetical protein [Pseudoalteromonas sp. MM17-2]